MAQGWLTMPLRVVRGVLVPVVDRFRAPLDRVHLPLRSRPAGPTWRPRDPEPGAPWASAAARRAVEPKD